MSPHQIHIKDRIFIPPKKTSSACGNIYIYIYLFHTPTYVDLFIYMHACVMEMKFDDLFFLSYFHKVCNYLVAAGAP